MVQINESVAFQRRVEPDISVAFRKVFSMLLPEEEIFLLRSSAQHLYRENEVIIRQMQPYSGIYVIVEGEVHVELDQGYPSGPLNLARLGRGDIFGEMSFVDNEPTSANVIAKTDAEILVVDEDVIQSLLVGDPTFGKRFYHSIAATLASRLRDTNPRIIGHQSDC